MTLALAAPGSAAITRIHVDEPVDGANQDVRGRVVLHTNWQRLSHQGARVRSQVRPGCRARTLVEPRAVATSALPFAQATPAAWDDSPILARGFRRNGAWTITDQHTYADGQRVSAPRRLYGIGPIAFTRNRYLQVRVFRDAARVMHGT